MKAIDILTQEHALILQAIESLSRARDMLERGKRPEADFFVNALEFLKSFADEFHHFKEEYLMFGLLADKKDGDLDTEIGALRFQHEKGRKYMEKINDALAGYTMEDEIATTILLENLSAYISLLRRHIHLEDNIFFKMAEKMLSEEEDRTLLAQFAHEEKRSGEPDYLEKSRERVTALRLAAAELASGE